MPSGCRHLSVAVTEGGDRKEYSTILFEASDRFGSMSPICQHVTEMLESKQAPLKLKYDKFSGYFYFQPTKTRNKFDIELLGWDDKSVLPVLGFKREEFEGKTFDQKQKAKLFATGRTTIDGDHPIEFQRVRTDLKLASLQLQFNKRFGTRKVAKRKATDVGKLKEGATVTPICIQDGHLILCDYLFSLAYFALVRVNPRWHEPGQSMLLDLKSSEERLCKIESTDALFNESTIPGPHPNGNRFEKLLEKLAEGKPEMPSGGNDCKILASYDVKEILCGVVLKEAFKEIRQEIEAQAEGAEDAEPSDSTCLKRIFEEKLKGEKEAYATTDEESW